MQHVTAERNGNRLVWAICPVSLCKRQKGFPQSKHWLASLFSVESHQLQKIAQSGPDRAPVCVKECVVHMILNQPR